MQKTETVVCDNVIATCHLGESEKVSVNVFDNRENHIENHTSPMWSISHVACGLKPPDHRHTVVQLYTQNKILKLLIGQAKGPPFERA